MSDIALLAPVPLHHLESAAGVTGKYVAFGTNAFDVINSLEERRGDEEVPVLIYASHDEPGAPLIASWIGRYIGYDRSSGGRHPKGDSVRPPTAAAGDESTWGLFWHVSGLRPVEPGLHLGKLTTVKLEPVKPLPPRGPVLIKLNKEAQEFLDRNKTP